MFDQKQARARLDQIARDLMEAANNIGTRNLREHCAALAAAEILQNERESR